MLLESASCWRWLVAMIGDSPSWCTAWWVQLTRDCEHTVGFRLTNNRIKKKSTNCFPKPIFSTLGFSKTDFLQDRLCHDRSRENRFRITSFWTTKSAAPFGIHWPSFGHPLASIRHSLAIHWPSFAIHWPASGLHSPFSGQPLAIHWPSPHPWKAWNPWKAWSPSKPRDPWNPSKGSMESIQGIQESMESKGSMECMHSWPAHQFDKKIGFGKPIMGKRRFWKTDFGEKSDHMEPIENTHTKLDLWWVLDRA